MKVFSGIRTLFGVFAAITVKNVAFHKNKNQETFPINIYLNDVWEEGMCFRGKNQSPIKLRTGFPARDKFYPFVFEDYNQPLKGVTATNTGRTVLIEYDSTKGPRPRFYHINNEYVLQEIRFHWPSEHVVDDKRYDLEVQLVHRNKRYKTAEDAAEANDGYAIFSRLYEAKKGKDNARIEVVQSAFPEISCAQNINKPVEIDGEVSAGDFVPSMKCRGFFSYRGSDTVPPCCENVMWSVYLKTDFIGLLQMRRFQRIEYSPGQTLEKNNRKLQRRNGRSVKIVSENPEVSAEL